jgi:hypothetical protein
MYHIAKNSIKHTVGVALNVLGFVQATGIHKPFISAAKSAHRVATHPATRSAAKVGWSISAGTGKAIYRVATHPATSRITHKAWLHGTKAARHTARFMVKVATKGFKLRA